MIASSAFVLAALTMTGIYMSSAGQPEQDNGYTLDFTALENGVDEKLKEIAQNNQSGQDKTDVLDGELTAQQFPIDDPEQDPLEVGSGLVEIPGLTGEGGVQNQAQTGEEVVLPKETPVPPAPTIAPEPISQPEPVREPEKPAPEQSTVSEGTSVVKTLNFAESKGLRRPLDGEILLPFSMSGSVYFSTLRDYRYNPALIIGAEAGTPVAACADGKVIAIFQNEEIGHAVTMDLGNGYQITYGQLEGINVSLNSYVNEGDQIAVVAKPTKYYCVEGSNLYLKLTGDDKKAVDPETLFR